MRKKWPEAIASIQADSGLEGGDWRELFEALDEEGSPTAYVFQCLHCRKLGGYQDYD